MSCESWRYIVFSNVYVLPLFWFELLNDNNFNHLCIFIQGAVIVFCIVKNYFISLPEDISESLLNLVGKIKIDDLSNVVWYGIPYSVSNISISRGIGQAGFCFKIGNQSQEIMRKYFIEYPFLHWNKDLLDGHRVTHILVQKEMHNKL